MKSDASCAVTRRVCLYGNSVIMGSLAATLQRYPQLEIATVAPPLSGPIELETLSPDVIVFDLDGPHGEEFLRLLGSCPRSLLVGVSPGANVVKVWTGLQLEELSTKDLLDVIEKQLERSPGFGARDHGPSEGRAGG